MSATGPVSHLESLKTVIWRSYLVENKTLEELVAELRENHGFHLTKAQLEFKLKQWNFRKNLPPHAWEYVSRQMSKRKREGKDASEVVCCGVLLPRKKVDRALNRYFPSSATEPTLDPKAPEDIDILVRTPREVSSSEDRPANLPWFTFQERLNEVLSSLENLALSESCQEAGATIKLAFQFSQIRDTGAGELWQNATRVALALEGLMPEKCPGEISRRSEAISQVGGAKPIAVLEILFYLLSNNMPGVSIWSQKLDRDIIALVKRFKLLRSFLRRFMKSKDASARAIVEQLFASAIRTLDIDVVHELLKEGVDPNQLIRLKYLILRPLGGASQNKVLVGDLAHPLLVAFTLGEQRLAKLLVSHGADILLALGDLSLLDYAFIVCTSHFLVGPEILHCILETKQTRLEEEWRNALGSATIHRDNLPARVLLDIYRTEMHLSPTIRAEALIYSIRNGYGEMVTRLLEVGTNPNERLKSGQSALWAAVYVGRLDICDLLVKYGASAGDEDLRAPTALQCAAYLGNIAAIKWLLNHGAELNYVGLEPYDIGQHWDILETMTLGSTALEAALYGGQSEATMMLLDLGAGLLGSELILALRQKLSPFVERLIDSGFPLGNALDADGVENALEVAILTGQFEAAQLILALEPYYYHPSALCAAVHMAILTLDNSLIETLLDRRAYYTLDAESPEGDWINTNTSQQLEGTALGCAAYFNSFSIVNLFLTNGFRPAFGLLPSHTIFLIAANQLLASPKASSTTLEDWGELSGWWRSNPAHSRHCNVTSPLELAVAGGNERMVSFMMKFGYKPDASCVLRAALGGSVECLETLLATAAATNLQELQLERSLQAAIRNQQPEIVEILLNAGVEVNTRPYFVRDDEVFYMQGVRYGFGARTALQAALVVGNTQIFDMILEHGADIHAPAAPENGATALQLASIQGLIGIVKKLLDMGADCNEPPAATCFGRTALEGAAENGRLDTLQLLLDSGVKISGAARKHYFRAIKFASRNGHHAVVTLLQDCRPWNEDDHIFFALEDLSERQMSYPSTDTPKEDVTIDNSQVIDTQGASVGQLIVAKLPDLDEPKQQTEEANIQFDHEQSWHQEAQGTDVLQDGVSPFIFEFGDEALQADAVEYYSEPLVDWNNPEDSWFEQFFHVPEAGAGGD